MDCWFTCSWRGYTFFCWINLKIYLSLARFYNLTNPSFTWAQAFKEKRRRNLRGSHFFLFHVPCMNFSPQTFPLYSSTEVSWKVAICSADNTSKYSWGITCWQRCGSLSFVPCHQAPKHSWGKVIINWAEIKLSVLVNWRVCWWLTK